MNQWHGCGKGGGGVFAADLSSSIQGTAK